MRKRISVVVALVLALCLAVSLSACSGGGGEEAVSDFEKITESGKLVIGITDYEPMNYYDESGELTGFDTEYATLVCEELGVEPEFIEIDWDNKEIELDAGNIDAIWNGMTYTEERDENMDFSNPYVHNELVVVVRSDDAEKYKAKEDLVSANIVAEGGSTAEDVVVKDDILKDAKFTPVDSLVNSLMEVSAGTADVSVVDSVMAEELVGKGAYQNLVIIPGLSLNTELLAIGFRTGSDLPAKVNEITQTLIENGMLPALAEKYGLNLAIDTE
ncbi:MAG: transporter substrate-binding domain-containing protein [Clostridiales Family XIII bacterium]|jgi:polar amino acid transport system substrate-binding protein|nr:transporter substrate-binding domain-containing protein [Clostridiales Family XIII bacterium]